MNKLIIFIVLQALLVVWFLMEFIEEMGLFKIFLITSGILVPINIIIIYIIMRKQTKDILQKKAKDKILEEKEKREDEKKEIERIKNLNLLRSKILSELDKDGNGIIDVVESEDDFDTLFEKHQKSINEINTTFVQQLVQVSS